MSIGKSFKGTLGNFFNPKGYSKHLSNAVNDFSQPARNLLKIDPLKDPKGALASIGDFGLRTVMPSTFIYNSVKPNNPEYDTSGPFEETARRGSNLITGLLMASPTMMAGTSTIGGILGEIVGGLGLEALSTSAGKMLDTASEVAPSLREKQQMFQGRVAERASDLMASGLNEEEATRQAAMSLLTEAPSYWEVINNR